MMMMAHTATVAAMPGMKHQHDQTSSRKTSSGISAKQVFMNKRFYLHFKCKANLAKASDVIKAFGGQIEEFLDKTTVSYLLTDIPSEQWPPNGKDSTLQIGVNHAVKIMSFQNLINYCREYLISQSSSDEDEELKVQTTELRAPFIKFEDTRHKYAPSVRELPEWPEINLDAPLQPGQTIFGFNPAHANTTPTPSPKPTSAVWPSNNIHIKTRQQHTTQMMTPKASPATPNMHANQCRRMLRKNATHCELCGVRVAPEKLEEHIDSHEHTSNVENAKWGEVESVIDSLPSLDSLITRKRVQLTNLDEHQEFLCLHKVETISQMFLNSSK
uniref:Uncharacterized protein n=1 Tax=Aceria tosichella TaxID=561515 RepID=A0A6G1SBU2_9ACAR